MKRCASISKLKDRLLRAATVIFFGKREYSCYAVIASCGIKVLEMYSETMRCPGTPELQINSVDMASAEIGISPRELRIMLILMFRAAVTGL